MFLRKVILNFIVSLCLLVLYKFDIYQANIYMGYKDFDLNFSYIINNIFTILLISSIQPNKIDKPSDFFLLIYPLFTILPFAALFPIRTEFLYEYFYFYFYFFILVFPLLIFKAFSWLTGVVVFRKKLSVDMSLFIYFIIFLILIGAVGGWLNRPSTAGFVFSYDRRLEARDIFVSGSFLSYLNAMIINGFAPYLAFYAGYRNKKIFFIVAVSTVLFYFYLLGTKAPILFVVLSFIMGKYVGNNKISKFNLNIYTLFILLFILSFIELIFLKYSFLSDYFFRRMLTVQPFLLSAYAELIFNDPANWNTVTGLNVDKLITFYVGEDVLGYVGLNANVNTFVYSLGQGGLIYYFIYIFIFIFIFMLLDSVYYKEKNSICLFLGFIISLLILEQSITTVLVSSGILILLLSLFFIDKSKSLEK